MLSDEEWRTLLLEGAEARLPAINATEYRKHADQLSFASPAMLACEDGEEYWVKHMIVSDGCMPTTRTAQIGGMVTDHVIGSLAPKIIEDVVPAIRLVSIPSDLIAVAPRLQNACPGLAHGSRNASRNCTGKASVTDFGHFNLPFNRPRFAGLAVLYGLSLASDHQVIYRMDGEPVVFSVDHGHFLPNGPNWTAAACSARHDGVLDPHVITACALTHDELAASMDRLGRLTATDVARAVAAPPDEWWFPVADRIAMARFLWARREAILGVAA